MRGSPVVRRSGRTESTPDILTYAWKVQRFLVFREFLAGQLDLKCWRRISEIGRFSRESRMAERDEQQVQLDFVQTLGLPDGAVAVNGRVWFQDRQGLRAVFIEQTPFYTYSLQDTVEHRFCAAQLVESGLASAKRVSEIFQIAPRTLSRVRRQLRQGGIGGLVSSP